VDRMIYTAMGGAARTLEHQAVLSHNVANTNTVGFRAQLAVYRSVPIVGEGEPTRVATVTATPSADFRPGPLQTTGRELDVAISGQGWFAVQLPRGGGEGYTRAGRFQIGSDNVLRTEQGWTVLSSEGAPIVVPESAGLTITSDGQITALGAGDPPNDVVALAQFKRVNPDVRQLERGDDGLFRLRSTDGQPAAALPSDASIGVQSGVLESSNVSAVQSMVGLIDNARRFEMQMKTIKSADSNAERANSLLSTNAGG
jgi:flagellar basal-body rod protein FlgF